MINNDKVSLMTKLAIYENKNTEDIKLSKYYKGDYVRHNVLKTIISVTIAYACILLFILFYNLEEVLAKAFELNYTMLGIEICVSYFVLIVIFTLIILFLSSRFIASISSSLNALYINAATIPFTCRGSFLYELIAAILSGL